jgi:hypothetical protein
MNARSHNPSNSIGPLEIPRPSSVRYKSSSSLVKVAYRRVKRFGDFLARVNQQPTRHHSRWMMCGHETLFHYIHVPLLTTVVSYLTTIHM